MDDPASRQLWWEQTRTSLAERDWPLLEGSVLRLLEADPRQSDLLDLLGYALLMQGRFQAARDVLERALRHGGTSFWTPHKLGDAERALQRHAAAVAAYELALQWGSDSPLSVRNLLEVLHAEAPHQALARLEMLAAPHPPPWDWRDPPPWLQGAIAASRGVQGLELADWLCQRGCPDPAVRALVWQERLHRLDLAGTLELLAGSDQPHEQALAARLRSLLQPP